MGVPKLRGLLGFSAADARMLAQFFRMMVGDRFLGSSLGVVWVVASPLLMLGIFTFVFGFVFKAKLPGAETSLSYVIWLIGGYGSWLAISESLQTSTVSVVANAGLVKNLKFKGELLPIAGGLAGLVPLMVVVVYLGVLLALDGRPPNATWLALFPVLVLQFMFVMGVGMILAAANVFVRDVSAALPNLLLMVLFATPIFYPLSTFPVALQRVMVFNPIYQLAESTRQILVFAELPPAWWFLYLVAVCAGTFLAGLFVFRRLKRHFDAAL